MESNDPPGTVLLSGVVGSTAYGLDHADSDVDRLGMFAVPTEQLHGLRRPSESHVSAKPDITYHEAGKAVRLILASNPAAMEILWLESYEVLHPLGEELIAMRRSLLSADGVRQAYLGDATQQYLKLQRRGSGTFGARTPEETAKAEKNARHLLRRIFQGTALHTRGVLPIRLSPTQAYELRRRSTLLLKDHGIAPAHLKQAEQVFDLPGVLPERADEGSADRWLKRVRREFYTP